MSGEAKPGQREFTSSVAAVFGGQAACAAVAVVTEICYARLLGPAGRGQISLCLMSLAFGVLVGAVGGEGTIILWSSDAKKKKSVWLPAVLLWGLAGCLIACCLWAVFYWRWHPSFLQGINPKLALVVLVSIPVFVFFDYEMAMLAGAERFRLRASIALIDQTAGLAGFIVLMLFFGRNAESALAGNFLGLLVGGGIAAILLKESLRGMWKVSAARENLLPTLSFGMRGQFGLLASFFNYRLDVFVVNYFLNPAQVGLYALGVVISESLWQIPSAAALALFPRTARTIDAGASEFTCRILRQVFLFTCVAGITIGVCSSLFVPLVFGERFRPSIAVVWWLLPGTIALSLGKVACSDLAGRGKNGYSSAFALVALAVTVGLDLFLIPRLGIQGAALASSVAYVTDATLILAAVKYELKVGWKAMLVPSHSELVSYQRLFLRCRDWLKPLTAAAGGRLG